MCTSYAILDFFRKIICILKYDHKPLDFPLKKAAHFCNKKYNIAISNEIMVAINEEYANENDIIQTGDIVAMIPPVSGG